MTEAQVTTYAYGLNDVVASPMRAHMVRVSTEPIRYERRATLAYSTRGQLTSLTDVVGMRSAFTYDDGDFIAALTTPYGTMRFTHETANRCLS
jgi:YD repeat-containing protein